MFSLEKRLQPREIDDGEQCPCCDISHLETMLQTLQGIMRHASDAQQNHFVCNVVLTNFAGSRKLQGWLKTFKKLRADYAFEALLARISVLSPDADELRLAAAPTETLLIQNWTQFMDDRAFFLRLNQHVHTTSITAEQSQIFQFFFEQVAAT